MKAVQQKWFVIVAMAAMLCLAGLVMTGQAFADQCVETEIRMANSGEQERILDAMILAFEGPRRGYVTL